jgi:hypothetical protein
VKCASNLTYHRGLVESGQRDGCCLRELVALTSSLFQETYLTKIRHVLNL